MFCINIVVLVDDNSAEVEYPASPVSRAHLNQLRSETAKLRLSGTLQQVSSLLTLCLYICADMYVVIVATL